MPSFIRTLTAALTAMGCCDQYCHWLLLLIVVLVHIGLVLELSVDFSFLGDYFVEYHDKWLGPSEEEKTEQNVTDRLFSLLKLDSDR